MIRARNTTARKLAGTLGAALMGVGGYTVVAAMFMSGAEPAKIVQSVRAEPVATSVREGTGGLEHAQDLSQAFRAAARRVLPAVAEIKGSVPHQGAGPSYPWHGPFGSYPLGGPFEGNAMEFEMTPAEEPNETGMGCGVIIDPSGIVLTNNHIVEGMDEVTVELADGRQFKTTEIHTDEHTDLALLRIESSRPLPAAVLGDSDRLQIGDWVLTIGSPFDLTQTTSAGIVSATGRTVDGAARARLLQTDAAINPGSSGGALVNMEGELVGITTAIASRDGGYQGIGFAVPSNVAKWVAAQLLDHGSVRRASIGIRTKDVTAEAPTGRGNFESRVVVSDLDDGSAAENAGLKKGDVILSVDGRTVTRSYKLHETIKRAEVGSQHQVRVLRDGRPMLFDVVTDLATSDRDPGSDRQIDPQMGEEMVFSRDLRAAVTEVTDEAVRQFGLSSTEGALVVEVDPHGAAYDAGIRNGMVIRRVGGRAVKSIQDFAEIMEQQSLEDGIRLDVETRLGTRKFSVGLPSR